MASMECWVITLLLVLVTSGCRYILNSVLIKYNNMLDLGERKLLPTAQTKAVEIESLFWIILFLTHYN